MSNPMRGFASILMPLGLAAAVIGAAPGAGAMMSGKSKLPAGLHVVSSPFISNSSLSAAAIASNDMWAAGGVSSSSGGNADSR